MSILKALCFSAVFVTFFSTSALARGVIPPFAAPAGEPLGTATSAEALAPSGGDVIAEAARWIGARNMTGKPGPWCASFASYVLRRTGRAPLASDRVSSAMSYGRRLPGPQVGALAVVSTRYGYEGHVGFVAGVNADGSIRLISGNWGRRVGDASISRRTVVAFVEVR